MAIGVMPASHIRSSAPWHGQQFSLDALTGGQHATLVMHKPKELPLHLARWGYPGESRWGTQHTHTHILPKLTTKICPVCNGCWKKNQHSAWLFAHLLCKRKGS